MQSELEEHKKREITSKMKPTPKVEREFKAQRILLLGKSNTGKSYAIQRYIIELIKAKVIRPENIYIFSKTYKSDDSQQELVQLCEKAYQGFEQSRCFEQINTDLLSDLYQKNKQIKETNPDYLPHIWIIMDDLISSSLLRSKQPALVDLFTSGRHFKISVSVCLQRFYEVISVTMRDQISQLVLFNQSAKRKLIQILEDQDNSDMSAKQGLQFFLNAYNDAIRQKDTRELVINTLVPFGEGRLQRGLIYKDPYYYDVQGNKSQIQQNGRSYLLDQQESASSDSGDNSESDEESKSKRVQKGMKTNSFLSKRS